MITTEVKTHVILTHSGGNYFITAQQNDKLRFVGLNDLFEVEGNRIKGSSIAEVMTTEKYYETYPEKKPARGINQFDNFPAFTEQIPINGMPSMVRGLTKFINEQKAQGIETPNAMNLLERWVKKLDKSKSINA